jgi:hypothetical protein
MVAPVGTTQKFINPPEDNYGVDAVFTDIYQNPNFVEPFGLGLAAIAREGNIFRQVSVAGINPGATGADNVLAAFVLPANSLDIAGRGISLTASGKTGPTNATGKLIRLWWGATTAVVGSTISGGTLIADTGSQTTVSAGWLLMANVFKAGAAGSNTQYAQCTGAILGNSHLGLGAAGALGIPLFPTVAENAAIIIAVTGNATTAVADIVLNFFEINAMN